MNVSRYISQKLTSTGAESFTRSVTKIAIISIAMGLAIMIVSFAILEGFRNQIQTKIFSFGGHLQLSKYDTNNSYEGYPISTNSVDSVIRKMPEIKNVQAFARKTAIIKTEEEVLGVVVKGIDRDYDLEPMRNNLIAGSVISFNDSAASDDIMMSKRMADKLKFKVGDEAIFYIIQNPPRIRKLLIKGIFQTGLEEFDDVFVIGDLQQIRDLNRWEDTLVGGYEIVLKNFDQLEPVSEKVFEEMRYDLQLAKITDQHAQLFDWLELLKRNVVIFLSLIVFVALFNMVSTIFIMILERTNMIGVLKALGATDRQIRHVFFFKGLHLSVVGLIFGNIIGLGFCFLQDRFKLIPLDPENYYMNSVPIHWDFPTILILNVLTLILTLLAILIPTYLIARIKPVKAIRFD